MKPYLFSDSPFVKATADIAAGQLVKFTGVTNDTLQAAPAGAADRADAIAYEDIKAASDGGTVYTLNSQQFLVVTGSEAQAAGALCYQAAAGKVGATNTNRRIAKLVQAIAADGDKALAVRDLS